MEHFDTVVSTGCETITAKEFKLEDLNVPFSVILSNAVETTVDLESGEILDYKIPDFDGLLRAVSITRLLHKRKLNGAEIKFVRKVIGYKQKDLASKIEMSAEHLSRCEKADGSLVMSASSEKLLRIFALKTVLKIHKMKSCDEKTELEDALDRLFDEMNPLSVFDASEQLVFHFFRERISDNDNARKPSSEGGRWGSDRRVA